MEAKLIIAAIAPVFIILLYIYIRDKWEKEPFSKLLLALFSGAIIVIPIIYLESLLSYIIHNYHVSNRISAFYNAFIVAGFSEETFKFLVLLILIWKSKDFNEKFDGIVYAVFVSLGFTLVENLLYVFNSGMQVAWSRAITAVPAHAIFGLAMGYHLSFARFSLFNKKRNILFALLVPIGLHGVYDFILMSREDGYLVVFVLYLFYLYKYGFKKIDELSSMHR